MTRIAPVHLPFNPRTLWFDACDFELATGDPVVVLTARGLEFGHMAADPFEVDESRVKCLKSPLKPVKRLATDEDVKKAEELERKAAEALPVFRELAAQTSEEMRPVAVEYLFGGDKAVFYFEAENRIDFRELVRKLASRFHIRIDMRQIGVRDQARLVGGLGHCGQELCCRRFGGSFSSVSIRMAKEQDLSLNPQKISGLCGRLMCCLRYEFDAYKDFKSRAPKQNSMVETPDGPAKVTALDMPREIVTLRDAEGKTVKVPLEEMDPPEGDAKRRTVVGEEAWERAHAGVGVASSTLGAGAYSTAGFTRDDKLGEAKAVRRGSSSRKGGEGTSEQRGQRRRRSTKVETSDRDHKKAGQKKLRAKRDGGDSSKKKKKGMQPRRSKQMQDRQARDGEAARAELRLAKGGEGARGPRPGQKSSGIQRGRGSHGGEPRDGSRSSSHRSSRNRSHKANSSGGAYGGQKDEHHEA